MKFSDCNENCQQFNWKDFFKNNSDLNVQLKTSTKNIISSPFLRF